MVGLGLLLIRLVFGLTFAAHGAQKLFGWFDGDGMDGTAKFFESVGLKPGRVHAALGGLGELVGGLLLALGLWVPIAAVIITGVMVMAIIKVHLDKGYWSTAGGWEYNLAIITVAIGVALIGPGAYTVAALFR
jgi:putative oxidoreductase